MEEDKVTPSVEDTERISEYSEIFDSVGSQASTPFYRKLTSAGYTSPIYVSASSEFFEELELLDDNDIDDILQHLEDAKLDNEEEKYQQVNIDEPASSSKNRSWSELYQALLDELLSLTDLINNNEISERFQGLHLSNVEIENGKSVNECVKFQFKTLITKVM